MITALASKSICPPIEMALPPGWTILTWACALALCTSLGPAAMGNLLEENWVLRTGGSPVVSPYLFTSNIYYKTKIIQRGNTRYQGPSEYGSFFYGHEAASLAGRRLVFSTMAQVHVLNPDAWAGMFVRVNGGVDRRVLAFDNMRFRPIKNGYPPLYHEIVVQMPGLPPEAHACGDPDYIPTDIWVGVFLSGSRGVANFGDLQLRITEPDHPVTTLPGPWYGPGLYNLEYGDVFVEDANGHY